MNLTAFLKTLVCRIPGTLVLIVVAWALWFPARNTPPQKAYGLSIDVVGQSWRFLSSGLTEKTIPSLLIATIMLAVLGGAAEYMLGTRQFLGFGLVLHIFAVISMLVVRDVMVIYHSEWAKTWFAQPFLSPSPWVFGVATLASAHFGKLWRRRLLVVLVVTTASMVLYSGTASDVARLTAVLAGAVMSRTPVRGSLRRSSLQEFRLLIATAFVMISAGPLMTSVNPYSDAPLSRINLLTWEDTTVTVEEAGIFGVIFNLLPLVIAATLAIGLARGRRIAWWCSQVFLLSAIISLLWEASRISHLTDINVMFTYGVPTVLPWAALIIVLLVYHKDFQAPAEKGTLKLLILRTTSFTILVSCLWVGSLMALRSHFEPDATLWNTIKSLRDVLLPPVLSRVFEPSLIPGDRLAWWMGLWPGPVVGIAIAFFLYIAGRSTHVELGDDAKHQRMQKILTTGKGGDHLSWMTLWPSNLVWEADDEAGYVAYRLHHSTVITLGEPVVNSEDETAQSLANAFEAFAERQGWSVAWYSVGSSFAAERPGTSMLQVAEEAIVSTELVEFR
ncbi:MAG: phosphatidylglycerol lysyltransferase domain-containing protein, partial [Corynebacterium sp.]|nr:phosphatidylglycerol lysyltransferase domain-containing protein [Corynebacterium sp.]